MRFAWLGTVLLALLLAFPGAASAVPIEVDTSVNEDDGSCEDGDCTWPEAVGEANTLPGLDNIEFSIGSGAQEIVLSGGFALTDPDGTIVDGTTQPGYDGSQPLIELDGAGAAGFAGIDLQGDNSAIRGIAVNGFAATAQIALNTSDNSTITGTYVGTNAAGTASTAADNASTGILITNGSDGADIGSSASASDRNLISGVNQGINASGIGHIYVNNYVGTDAAGTGSIANGSFGIATSGTNDVVGATGANGANVLSGNSTNGLQISGTNITVRGNRIGTNAAGTGAIGNSGDGIFVQAGTDPVIGGALPGQGNLISANNRGIFVDDGFTVTGLQILGNVIGTDVSQSFALPNGNLGIEIHEGGVAVGGPASGEGNVIAGNGLDGIRLGSDPTSVSIRGNRIGITGTGTALGNQARGISLATVGAGTALTVGGSAPGEANIITNNNQGGISFSLPVLSQFDIRPNSIFANNGLGLDLQADSAVEPNDGSTEPDGLQNYPVLSSAVRSGASTNVAGSLISDPGATFRIDYYSSPSCDSLGFGEGQTFLGSANRLTNGAGLTTANTTLPAVAPGQFITTVATRLALPRSSEFSQCRLVTAAASPTADLGVFLSSTPNPAVPGDPLTYRMTTVNRGPAAAVNARSTLTLPAGVDYRSASAGCAPSGSSVTCSLGTLANGQSATRDVVVVPRREGSLSASAQATSSTGDPSAAATSSTSSARLPAPEQRKTFNSSVKAGDVTVKCPGDGKFRPIVGDNDLSFRCLVDTRKGRLEVTTTAGGGKTQSALFYEGVFKASQTKGRKPVTELSLAGKLQTGSWAKKGTVQQARRRRRRLWGRGRGRFRTRGRRGSASVRGTTWLVEDRSNNTTFFKVTSGRVAVRDFGRRKTIQLRRGKSYTAKPRRRRR